MPAKKFTGYPFHHLSSLVRLQQIEDFTCLGLNDDITEDSGSSGHDLLAEIDHSLAPVEF